jgi:hypothetical protein
MIPASRLILLAICLVPANLQAQSNSSAAAGLAAGTALGASSSQSSTTASSAGGANAPIEMNVMVYGGIKQISGDIAEEINRKLPPAACLPKADCNERQLLLEDSSTMPLISLSASWDALQNSISDDLVRLKTQINDNTAAIDRTIKELKKTIQDDIDKRKKDADMKTAQQAQNTHARNNSLRPRSEFDQPVQLTTPTTTATTTGSTGGTSSGGATTPIGLTYLGDIGTALTTAKNGISYSSSTISPATQSLTTALAKDLKSKSILLYTSASTINLDPASKELSDLVIGLQEKNAVIQQALNFPTTIPTLTDDQKKDPVLQGKVDAATAQVKSLSATITADASASAQLVSSFQSWQAGTDGNGGIILSDAIRGRTLKEAIGTNVPALQLNIDAAGGNTRTNSYFLFNLFYTPKPSFNGGVVVTYELRDGKNVFLTGDTLKALYDYSKWKPNCFAMSKNTDVNGTTLGTGRFASGAKQGHAECQTR